jgi:hypothetical protein
MGVCNEQQSNGIQLFYSPLTEVFGILVRVTLHSLRYQIFITGVKFKKQFKEFIKER